jgi:hypothetical protein
MEGAEDWEYLLTFLSIGALRQRGRRRRLRGLAVPAVAQDLRGRGSRARARHFAVRSATRRLTLRPGHLRFTFANWIVLLLQEGPGRCQLIVVWSNSTPTCGAAGPQHSLAQKVSCTVCQEQARAVAAAVVEAGGGAGRLVPAAGLEPATSRLQGGCSTVELRRHPTSTYGAGRRRASA